MSARRGEVMVAVLVAAAATCIAAPEGVAREEPADSIAELQRAIAVRDRVIDDLLRRIEALEKTVADFTGKPSQATMPDAPAPAAQAQQPSNGEPAGEMPLHQQEAVPLPEPPPVKTVAVDRQEQERLINTAFERTLIDRGGLLLPPYTLEVQPDFTYVHSSSDRIVIDALLLQDVLAIGDIFNERVRRDSYLFSATLRLGLPWDLQVETRVPYGLEDQKIFSADNEETTTSIDGVGDVEFSLSHQLTRERGWIPDLLANVRWKSKTGQDTLLGGSEDNLPLGTGYHSVQGTVTAVKVRDPVAFFGGFSYSYNLKESREIGDIDPGDSLGAHLGVTLALNLDTSLNFSYQQRYTWRTELNGEDIPGSYFNTGTFSAGVSYILDAINYKSLDVNLGIGLTEDAPDVQFNVSLPMRYSF